MATAARRTAITLSAICAAAWLGCSSPDEVGAGADSGADGGAPDAQGLDTFDGNVADGDLVEAIEWRVIPAPATDPAIEQTIGDHIAAVKSGSRLGRLLVFFPGTGARPDQYSLFLRHAAGLGYHVVGLSYDNRYAVNWDLCPGAGPASGCHEDVRIEILTGIESGYSPPDVDPVNSAYYRLVRLLQYLAANFPSEDWQSFLDGEALEWGLITTAGHSQGGGHAAMTARLHTLAGALLFDATEPMPWTAHAGFATPAERFFGFAHHGEPIFDPIVLSWENLAMPGALTDVDDVAPPYGGAHRLATASTECRGDPTSNGFHHNCPVVDEFLPLDAEGVPIFVPVWDTMLAP
jgi:pimeloyl-ACP methyl ester carboxylesterase